MSIQAVSPMDVSWLWMESDTTPMHASLTAIFSRPPEANPDFLERTIEQFRSHTVATRPYERRRRRSGLGRIWPHWETIENIDLTYHLRSWQLSAPGGRAELEALVSRLHGIPLDQAHPPWTVDIIGGLENERFAVCCKMHHALADGTAGIDLLSVSLSEDPDARGMAPGWAYRKPSRAGVRSAAADDNTPHPRSHDSQLSKSATAFGKATGTVKSTAGAMRYAARGVSARPWSAPRSAMNTPITARRRIVTQTQQLLRFRALGERAGGTVNDVLLAACAGGLRRYLHEMGQLPDEALTTMIPVSLRLRDHHQHAPNALTVGMLSLATDVADPRVRFEAIRASTTELKQRLVHMGGRAIDVYTMLTTLPIAAGQIIPGGGRVPPPFNVLISNLPGPRERMYFNGARMDELQGLPLLFDRQSLAIVAVSYADQLELSFTACEAAHPHIGRLARYVDDALAELEAACQTSAGSA